MKNKIEQHLQIIKGQRLVETYRSVNMEGLTFEPIAKLSDIHACYLHLQASWRFIQNGKIMVGSQDVYETPTGVEMNRDFDYEVKNLRDEKLRDLLSASELVVSDVLSNDVGDLFLYFYNGAELQIMATSSDASHYNEYWRFIISRATGTEHFTVNGTGIEV